MINLILILVTSLTSSAIQANDPFDGYAIIRSDTVFGKIQINFDAGSITVRQDSINRMFVSGIERVTLLNKHRDTYLLHEDEDKSIFLKVLVDGTVPLLEFESHFYTLSNKLLVRIKDEKSLYELFGKKDVKEYVFLRNIAIEEKHGKIDIFQHFNSYISY